jgi:hypothetical protein
VDRQVLIAPGAACLRRMYAILLMNAVSLLIDQRSSRAFGNRWLRPRRARGPAVSDAAGAQREPAAGGDADRRRPRPARHRLVPRRTPPSDPRPLAAALERAAFEAPGAERMSGDQTAPG